MGGDEAFVCGFEGASPNRIGRTETPSCRGQIVLDKSNFGKSRGALGLAMFVLVAIGSFASNEAGTIVIDDYRDPIYGYRRGQVLAELLDDDGIESTPEVWVSSKLSTQRMFIGRSTPGFDDVYNAFVVFNLAPALSETVVAATLRLELTAYESSHEKEDISIHEVTTPVDAGHLLRTSWDQEAESYPIFLDLQDTTGGNPFGKARVNKTDPIGTILNIKLSEQAVAAINDSGGLFALGIHLDSLSDNNGTEEGLRFSNGTRDYKHQLILTVPDAGATVGLLSLGWLGCLAVARGGRRS